MGKIKYLYLTIGPVQGFVAQARRTRDLWVSSFLLSYLAGHGMLKVIKNKNGEIIIPKVHEKDNVEQITDPLLNAINQHQKGNVVESAPYIGSLPNRFKAKVPADFNSNECIIQIKTAWENIAQKVWEKYLAPIAEKGQDVEKIWQRQIQNFWDISWVISEQEDSDNLLDRRKNWRSYVPTMEPGDKCTLMGNLQELSGFIGSKKGDREKQKEFWGELRKKVGYELREDERLCAIALIKRLFPRVAKEAIGWEVPISYPSTSYISAVTWFTKAIEEKPQWCQKFVNEIQENDCLSDLIGFRNPILFNSIKEVTEKSSIPDEFIRLEGNFFYKSILENHRMWPENTEKTRKNLVKLLDEHNKQPSPFYAVLLMDGDRLGALMQSNKQAGEEISKALAAFNQKVPQFVCDNNGVLIYAGGDDVLALVTLEEALPLAIKIREEFKKAFELTSLPLEKATISAAIIFAHHHAPLKSILREAHSQLDNVAKEKTGRDALAVAVWSTSGLTLQWSNPWEKIINANKDTNILEQLIEQFSGNTPEEKQYNSGFFYNIRQRFSILLEDEERLIPEFNYKKLLMAEYLKNRQRMELSKEDVEERIDDLLKLCCRYKRTEVKDKEKVRFEIIPDNTLNIDGALLVKFLATKGVEKW